VWDNLAGHKTPALVSWPATRPGPRSAPGWGDGGMGGWFLAEWWCYDAPVRELAVACLPKGIWRSRYNAFSSVGPSKASIHKAGCGSSSGWKRRPEGGIGSRRRLSGMASVPSDGHAFGLGCIAAVVRVQVRFAPCTDISAMPQGYANDPLEAQLQNLPVEAPEP